MVQQRSWDLSFSNERIIRILLEAEEEDRIKMLTYLSLCQQVTAHVCYLMLLSSPAAQNVADRPYLQRDVGMQ